MSRAGKCLLGLSNRAEAFVFVWTTGQVLSIHFFWSRVHFTQFRPIFDYLWLHRDWDSLSMVWWLCAQFLTLIVPLNLWSSLVLSWVSNQNGLRVALRIRSPVRKVWSLLLHKWSYISLTDFIWTRTRAFGRNSVSVMKAVRLINSKARCTARSLKRPLTSETWSGINLH